MIEAQTVLTLISIVVALGSLITAMVVIHRNKIKDDKNSIIENKEAHHQIEIVNSKISTRLDAIDNGVRDIKADNRSIKEEIRHLRDNLSDDIKEVNTLATNAFHLAEKANSRIDDILRTGE